MVEDNKDAARLIQRILQARGDYQIELAHNGQQGLDLIRHIHPDLVITDLMMPDVDGFQMIEAIKDDDTLRSTPIIVLTAKELTVQERERLSGQISSLLQKGSFLNEELLQSIVKAISN